MRRRFYLQLAESGCQFAGPGTVTATIILILSAAGPGIIATFLLLSLCLIVLHACLVYARKAPPNWEAETDKSHKSLADMTLRDKAIQRWIGEDTRNDLDAL